MSAQISSNLLNKDGNSFWKSWNQMNGGQEPPSSMIDGSMNFGDIANCFSKTYSSVYTNSASNNTLKHENVSVNYDTEVRVYCILNK